MKSKLSLVRADIIRPLITATLVLAITLTQSCSSDDGNGEGGGTSSPSVGGDPPSSSSAAGGGNSSSSGGGSVASSSSAGGGVSSSSAGGSGGSSSSGGGSVISSSSAGESGDIVGTFLDSRDNKTYKTVKIGEQTWLAENLNYDVPSNETDVCNETDNCAEYGRFYDLETAKTACPLNWHLPSKAEWDALTSYIEGKEECTICDATHLKATSGWDNKSDGSSGNGLDSYKFAALPSGYRSGSDGTFKSVGAQGHWWSYEGFDRRIIYTRDYADWNDSEHRSLSIRCIKD